MSLPFNKGFTLIELLVSIAIMTAITTIVMSNQPSYTDNAALENQTQGLSLDIRQMQAYSISVKLAPGATDFNTAYGISFDMNYPTSYVAFLDKNHTETYNGDWGCSAVECLYKKDFTNGNRIQSVCPILDSSGSTPSDCSSYNKFDVTFMRPNTQAIIVLGGATSNPQIYGAKITIASQTGKTHSIMIYSTGQIAVN